MYNPISKYNKVIKVCAVAFFVFLCACSDDACREPMNSSMQVLFYSRQSPTVAADLGSFSVYVVNSDGSLSSTVYKDTAMISSFELPLTANAPVSKFYFSNSVLHDTMIVLHSNTYEFVSAECGSRFVAHIDSFYFSRGHFEDSISVTNPSVTGVYNGQNVKIYMD